MTKRVGLELCGDRIRAVTLSKWNGSPLESFEIRWDPALPDDAVSVLQRDLGKVSGIAIGIGLEFLQIKHVKLPPVSVSQKRRILMLEPDRFFPVTADVVVAASDHSDLVFAADAATVAAWLAAFERWAPVDVIEAAPTSLTRALRRARIVDGTFGLPSATGEYGIVEIAKGLITSARRMSGGLPPSTHQRPSVNGVAPDFVPAFGAAFGAESPIDEMMAPDSTVAAIRGRRRSALAVSVLNLVLALIFAIAGVDRYRARVLELADAELERVKPQAGTAAVLQSRLAQLDVESSTARGTSEARADPLPVLAALSRRLPRDASVLSVRAEGRQWQLDGTARDAGAIIPALDAEPMFEDVRFLAATSRFREANRSYETFSVAFRANR